MATYDFTPVNGGTQTVNVLYATNAHKAFVITVRSTSNGDNTAVDLTGADGAYGSLFDLILRELSPALAFGANASTGVIHVVMDGVNVDAASIKARLVQLDGVGSDTAVTLGTSITVA